MNDAPDPSGLYSIFSSGGLVLTLLTSALFFTIRYLRRRGSKQSTFTPYSYDGAGAYNAPAPQRKTLINPGWYPLPDGLQDRYRSETGWTDYYRPHTIAGQVNDAPPDAELENEQTEASPKVIAGDANVAEDNG